MNKNEYPEIQAIEKSVEESKKKRELLGSVNLRADEETEKSDGEESEEETSGGYDDATSSSQVKSLLCILLISFFKYGNASQFSLVK